MKSQKAHYNAIIQEGCLDLLGSIREYLPTKITYSFVHSAQNYLEKLNEYKKLSLPVHLIHLSDQLPMGNEESELQSLEHSFIKGQELFPQAHYMTTSQMLTKETFKFCNKHDIIAISPKHIVPYVSGLVVNLKPNL